MSPVTLITGAASGLGWALAQRYFALGHRLVLVDMNEQQLQARCQELGEPKRLMAVTLDLTDSDRLKGLLADVVLRFGRLDTLINNAGITQRSLAADTDPAVLRRVMAVDWQAPV
ncbi:MAG: SDR family NAD(P)-dependent oxidoreductase, partial [Alcanivoracaceae bacterium]